MLILARLLVSAIKRLSSVHSLLQKSILGHNNDLIYTFVKQSGLTMAIQHWIHAALTHYYPRLIKSCGEGNS
jgi:hypothetical protein